MSRSSLVALRQFKPTPLFFHRENSDEAEDSSSEEEDDSMSSPYVQQLAGDSSGMTSSGIRTASGVPLVAAKKKQPKHDDGPIIFYNNARFCTDLSGDRRTNPNYDMPSYAIASTIPIGKRHGRGDGEAGCGGRGVENNLIDRPVEVFSLTGRHRLEQIPQDRPHR